MRAVDRIRAAMNEYWDARAAYIWKGYYDYGPYGWYATIPAGIYPIYWGKNVTQALDEIKKAGERYREDCDRNCGR